MPASCSSMTRYASQSTPSLLILFLPEKSRKDQLLHIPFAHSPYVLSFHPQNEELPFLVLNYYDFFKDLKHLTYQSVDLLLLISVF